jgi:hypothetical protein
MTISLLSLWISIFLTGNENKLWSAVPVATGRGFPRGGRAETKIQIFARGKG